MQRDVETALRKSRVRPWEILLRPPWAYERVSKNVGVHSVTYRSGTVSAGR
jgi:hypothetical protein